MKALLSLSDKTGCVPFARSLIDRGFSIISSGGTAKYLLDNGIPVTEVSKITGYEAVLGHRVVTLAPQIHGGLLATPEMREELEALDWPKIDLLYVTLYPLQEEFDRPDSTFESCLEKTDIGGPTLIRSANKGGDVIVITDRNDEKHVIDWLDAGMPGRKAFLFNLRARAELLVADYIQVSAKVYARFFMSKGNLPA